MLRQVTEDARKLSAQRPFKNNSALSPVYSATGSGSGSGSGGGSSRILTEAEERRRQARRLNAKAKKDKHTPEAVPPSASGTASGAFACAIDFEKLFNLPKRPSIVAARPVASGGGAPGASGGDRKVVTASTANFSPV